MQSRQDHFASSLSIFCSLECPQMLVTRLEKNIWCFLSLTWSLTVELGIKRKNFYTLDIPTQLYEWRGEIVRWTTQIENIERLLPRASLLTAFPLLPPWRARLSASLYLYEAPELLMCGFGSHQEAQRFVFDCFGFGCNCTRSSFSCWPITMFAIFSAKFARSWDV